MRVVPSFPSEPRINPPVAVTTVGIPVTATSAAVLAVKLSDTTPVIAATADAVCATDQSY